MDTNKCKCMLCSKIVILNDNLIPVMIPLTKKEYLICKDCFEYLKNKDLLRGNKNEIN